jgi:triosephosphate isomerase
MNKNVAEARILVNELVPELQTVDNVDIVLCPPFPSLLAVSALLEGTDIGLGAQNMYWELSGAFTGEISPVMLAEFCDYVIIGHSERRAFFNETDETVNQKVKAALNNNLQPILCVGETFEENETGRTEEIVTRQVINGLLDLEGLFPENAGSSITIAYEPVWAIGTGKAATVDGASDVIRNVIRKTLNKVFGNDFSQSVRVLYGGSVKGNNAAEFFSNEEIDGALVGGASLKTSDFVMIAKAASMS